VHGPPVVVVGGGRVARAVPTPSPTPSPTLHAALFNRLFEASLAASDGSLSSPAEQHTDSSGDSSGDDARVMSDLEIARVLGTAVAAGQLISMIEERARRRVGTPVGLFVVQMRDAATNTWPSFIERLRNWWLACDVCPLSPLRFTRLFILLMLFMLTSFAVCVCDSVSLDAFWYVCVGMRGARRARQHLVLLTVSRPASAAADATPPRGGAAS
jgi:hypothetical protein